MLRHPRAQAPARFRVEETTIAQIESSLRDGSLTCRALVEQYLARIDAYDKKGAALNAIVLVNPDALKTADDLDRRFRQSGAVGPLHCVPVLVKDNYETFDMPTTAGSLSLKGMMTGKDAFVVKRLRDAGAVMIAKSNMAEFAFSPIETVNSILPGYTRNPVRHQPRHRRIERRIRRRRRGELRRASAWPATPAIRFAVRPRIRLSSASARRWGW